MEEEKDMDEKKDQDKMDWENDIYKNPAYEDLWKDSVKNNPIMYPYKDEPIYIVRHSADGSSTIIKANDNEDNNWKVEHNEQNMLGNTETNMKIKPGINKKTTSKEFSWVIIPGIVIIVIILLFLLSKGLGI